MYKLLLKHSLSACNCCQNGWPSHATGHFFWPIRPSNMFATTTMSALHQPFPSCKEEKFNRLVSLKSMQKGIG